MMSIKTTAVLILSAAALSCTSSSSGTSAYDLDSCGSITTIAREQYRRGRASEVRMVSVAYSQSDLESILARLYPNVESRPDVPDIDFARESVVIAELGTRSAGGYDVTIKCLQQIPEGVRL